MGQLPRRNWGVLCRALHSTSEMLRQFVLLLGLTNCVLAGGYGAAGGSQATVGTGGCGSGKQGSCCSGADCPAEAPVCSEYGFCQCGSYQVGGPACGPGVGGGGVGGGCGSNDRGSCCSSADCPYVAPVCSEHGYCQCASYQVGGPACGPGIGGQQHQPSPQQGGAGGYSQVGGGAQNGGQDQAWSQPGGAGFNQGSNHGSSFNQGPNQGSSFNQGSNQGSNFNQGSSPGYSGGSNPGFNQGSNHNQGSSGFSNNNNGYPASASSSLDAVLNANADYGDYDYPSSTGCGAGGCGADGQGFGGIQPRKGYGRK